jgi:hypothetical protein
MTIAGSQHFSCYEPITNFLLTLYNAVAGNVNDLLVSRLNGQPHVEPIDAVGPVSQRVAGWRNYLLRHELRGRPKDGRAVALTRRVVAR